MPEFSEGLGNAPSASFVGLVGRWTNLFMKMIYFLVIAMTLANVTVFAQESGDLAWKKAKEKNGITIFTRKSEASKVNELSANTCFETNLTTLVAVFIDIPSYPDWLKDCKLSKLLKQTGPQDLYYYSEFKVPFPFDNRDLIQYINIQQNPESREVTITLTNQPSLVPEKKGLVRMPVADGFWKFKPVEGGKIQVKLQYKSDPGGNIPAWLVNAFNVNIPFGTITNLEKQITKEEYRKAKIDWITN